MYTFKDHGILKMAELFNSSRLNEKQQAWLLKHIANIKLGDLEEIFFYLSEFAVNNFWSLFCLVN